MKEKHSYEIYEVCFKMQHYDISVSRSMGMFFWKWDL